jgi:hypothetical protein
MPLNISPALPALSAVNAPQVANSAAELSLLPDTFRFDPNRFNALGEGSVILFSMGGKFSSKASGQGGITLRARLGGVVVWDSGALALPGSKVDTTFKLEIELFMRSGGSAAMCMGIGELVLGTSIALLPATLPVDRGPVDLNSVLDLDITAQFSTADANNKIQMLTQSLIA